MKRALVVLALLAVLGLALAACGGTSTGPGGGGGAGNVGTQGQDTGQQPAAGGLKTGAYTAAHNICSLLPLDQLAQQNGLPSNATAAQVAKKISGGEATASARKQAYQGCLDGIKSG